MGHFPLNPEPQEFGHLCGHLALAAQDLGRIAPRLDFSVFLGLSPLRFASPAPPKRGVRGAHPCPAVSRPAPVTPCPFPESARACDPPRQRRHSACGLQPSDSPESSSQGTRGTRRPTPRPPHPRGRRAAPSAGSFPALSPRGRGSGRARVGAAPVSSPRIPGVIPLAAGPPPPPPPPQGGARPGAGRRAGAALFPASPKASLALRREPSRLASRRAGRRGENREAAAGAGGGGRTRATAEQEPAAAPSPSPGRSGRRPHVARFALRTQFRWEREEAPGPNSGGGGPPGSPGAPEPRIRRGGPRRGWRRPRPRRCRLRG